MKKLIILFLCVASQIWACEPLNKQTWTGKRLGQINQSSFMHACSKYTQGDPEPNYIPLTTAGPASKEYQDFGTEAQTALGVPVEHHVPVIKMGENYPLVKHRIATANSDGIFVNEERLNSMSYGAKRSAFMHESTHIKHHDNLTAITLSLASLPVATVGTYSILKLLNFTTWRKKISFTIGVVVACQSFKKYSKFMERRADIQGHYATQCSKCVLESMQSNKNALIEYLQTTQPDNITEDELLKLDQQRAVSGYLTQAELEQIAKDLGDKKCSYHSNQQ